MKRYGEYKDSGVPWIGEIPEGWMVSKVGRYFRIHLGKMLQPEQKEASDTVEQYLCAANIQKTGINLEPKKEMWFSLKDKETYEVRQGDLLVVEGGDVGLSALYTLDNILWIQNALHRVRPQKNSSNRFLSYWLMYIKGIGYMDLVCNKATIAHYTKEKFVETPLIMPSLVIQDGIADYLDRKTGAIDALIVDKQKLIDLLKEKRQAVISEAVTKGLDKTVALKDSGIEWIGQMPGGWEVRKLKALGVIKGRIGFKGYTTNDLVDEEEPGRAIVLGGTNIMKNGTLSYKKISYLSELKYLESPEIMLYGGEILITKVGAGTGENALYTAVEEKVTINPNVMIFQPASCVLGKYINYFLLSNYIKNDFFLESQKSGAQPAINQEYVKSVKIVVPSLYEQRAIVDYLDCKTTEIDSLVSDIETQIEKLKEFRQAIISEAVTGKVAI